MHTPASLLHFALYCISHLAMTLYARRPADERHPKDSRRPYTTLLSAPTRDSRFCPSAFKRYGYTTITIAGISVAVCTSLHSRRSICAGLDPATLVLLGLVIHL